MVVFALYAADEAAGLETADVVERVVPTTGRGMSTGLLGIQAGSLLPGVLTSSVFYKYIQAEHDVDQLSFNLYHIIY